MTINLDFESIKKYVSSKKLFEDISKDVKETATRMEKVIFKDLNKAIEGISYRIKQTSNKINVLQGILQNIKMASSGGIELAVINKDAIQKKVVELASETRNICLLGTVLKIKLKDKNPRDLDQFLNELASIVLSTAEMLMAYYQAENGNDGKKQEARKKVSITSSEALTKTKEASTRIAAIINAYGRLKM